MDASRKAIQSCVTSILKNANALLWLSQVKDQDSYTAEHSLRVGILAIAFGRFLGFNHDDLEMLGLCGMLHNVGKIKVPDEILNKPARLSRVEFEIMKEHAALGKDILREQKSVDKLIIDTAHFHHERCDGKGYPEKLNAALLHQFIRMVGIYPPGTLVEMTNGEVGIIVSANPDSRLRPKVELVLTADKKIRLPYIINLLEGIPDSSGSVYVIKEGITNGTYGVDVKDYILK